MHIGRERADPEESQNQQLIRRTGAWDNSSSALIGNVIYTFWDP